jgi:hypothetical protein
MAERARGTLNLLMVLDPELPGDAPVEIRVEARGVDYFRAEELTGIDPWEALGDVAGATRLNNRFLKAIHGLGYAAGKRVAPSLVGDSFDRFLDRAQEVTIIGQATDDDAEVPDARPTDAAATSG